MGETNGGKSRDFVADVLEHGCKLVQRQALVVILIVEFKEFFDLQHVMNISLLIKSMFYNILGQGAFQTLASSF